LAKAGQTEVIEHLHFYQHLYYIWADGFQSPAFAKPTDVTSNCNPHFAFNCQLEMERSKSIAGIVGPTLIVMVFSEMRVWNPTLYDAQIVPLIYLNGVLLFVAGLAIVRNHSIWTYSWQTVVTIVGYIGIVLGLFRMFFPSVQKTEFRNDTSVLVVEVLLILLGIFLTIKAYWPTKS